MPQPSTRSLRYAGIAVAVVLLGLAFYPGALATPYVTADETPKYAHTIVPESSPNYDDYTEGYDHEVYQYDDLSPVGRELFDRTRAAEPRAQHNDERRYIPDVCRGFVLVCDEYAQDELPEQFTYGTELDYDEAFVFVEDGDERYLLRTGTTGHMFLAPFPFRFFLGMLALLPLSLFVAVVTFGPWSDRSVVGAVGGVALVAVLSVLTPYVEMAGFGSARVVGLAVLVGVWVSILAAGGHRFYQWVTEDEQRGSPGRP